jgi:hypothetical protein
VEKLKNSIKMYSCLIFETDILTQDVLASIVMQDSAFGGAVERGEF